MRIPSRVVKEQKFAIYPEEKKSSGKKGREIILKALLKARDIKEQAINEAMIIEREISKLRVLKRQLELDIG